jgi:hypothetical protein
MFAFKVDCLNGNGISFIAFYLSLVGIKSLHVFSTMAIFTLKLFSLTAISVNIAMQI